MFSKLLCAVGVCVAVAAAASATVVIDDFTSFDTNMQTVNVGAGELFVVEDLGWGVFPGVANVKTVTETGLTVLGGSRVSTFDFSNGTFGNSGTVTVEEGLLHLDGQFTFNSGTGSWAASMLYAGSQGAPFDFSAEDMIRITMEPDHLGFQKPSILSVTLTDADSSNTQQIVWDEAIWPEPPVHADFPLTDFAGIDLAAVTAVNWSYEGDWGNDIAFSGIAAVTDEPTGFSSVPEPMTAACVLVAISGLGGYVRRRTKA